MAVMAATVATLMVAAIHLFIMVIETLLWTKPFGRKVFGNSPEKAEITKVLAANQGVYNGCIGLGLVWALGANNPGAVSLLLIYVVVVAGYGAYSTSKMKILLIQGVPAVAALILGAIAHINMHT